MTKKPAMAPEALREFFLCALNAITNATDTATKGCAHCAGEDDDVDDSIFAVEL